MGGKRTVRSVVTKVSMQPSFRHDERPTQRTMHPFVRDDLVDGQVFPGRRREEAGDTARGVGDKRRREDGGRRGAERVRRGRSGDGSHGEGGEIL
jgi:hypothetical protein